LVLSLVSVKKQVYSGYKVVDVMVPFGTGQRMLLTGNANTGKATFARELVVSQKVHNQSQALLSPFIIFCVYVFIGQRFAQIMRTYQYFEQCQALDYTVLIGGTTLDAPGQQYLFPFVGCAVSEFFALRGHDVLCVMDDLNQHAAAYRQIGLLLEEIPGREAYPGDLFFLHARLLERSAQFITCFQGGSITAFPVVDLVNDDVTAYLPTNIISITDGQLTFGTMVGGDFTISQSLSVSRIGARGQHRLLKLVSRAYKAFLREYQTINISKDDRTPREQFIANINHLYGQAFDQRYPLPFEAQVTM